MLTLAFESSAIPASVALLRDGELISQYSQYTTLTHSRTLQPMAEARLKNTGVLLEDVDLIACAHGPGSFTGIRIGIATVKGLAWALQKPCIGVSTLEAMAWQGISAGGTVCAVMDARRNQVYHAMFRIQGGAPVRLTEDRALSLEELRSETEKIADSVFLVGDGAKITAAYFAANGIPWREAPSNLVMQSAWGVAMAAIGKSAGNADSLLPVYLRLSQAERERQERLERETDPKS